MNKKFILPLALITIFGIFATIECFKLGTLLGCLLLVVVLLTLGLGIMLMFLFTKRKMILSVVMVSIGLVSFFVYFAYYSTTEDYRKNKIDVLYSRIYTKVNKTKGQGWVDYKYKDIYGNEEKGFYYDDDKVSVDSNSNQMMKRIKALRKDIPLLTNIQCSPTGKLTWDPVEIGESVEYTIYANDEKLETTSRCEYQLNNIQTNLIKIKIVVSERNERYYNSTENHYDAKFDIVTVTIIDIYGRDKTYKLFKGKTFDVKNHSSYTSLFNNKLYYDDQRVNMFDPSSIINTDLILYEGANDYGIEYDTLCEVNPNVQGIFTIPKEAKIIGTYAFKGCNLITKIIIDHDIETIEGEAFYSLTSLKEVIIKAKVDKIEKFAFYNCNNVVYYYLSSNVLDIEDFAFENNKKANETVLFLCEKYEGYSWDSRWYQFSKEKNSGIYRSGIVHKNISLDTIWYDSEGLYILDQTTKEATLLRYLSTDKNSYTAVEYIHVNGVKYKVSKIGYCAFANHDELLTIYFGKNIIYCEEKAFYSIDSTVYFSLSSDYKFSYGWDDWSGITVVWNYGN